MSETMEEVTMKKKLIKLVEINRHLYDSLDPDYGDESMAEVTWIEIGAELDMEADVCKLIWNELRNEYTDVIERRRKAEHEAKLIDFLKEVQKDTIKENHLNLFFKFISTTVLKFPMIELCQLEMDILKLVQDAETKVMNMIDSM